MSALNIEPKKVFDFFELIASVPHGSDNTAQITELCCKFARQRGLEYYCDKLGNVIIYKNASCGYESDETVILQGHLDMVAVKTADCTKDLEKDGLDLKTDGKYLWAEGTSLGADDGIAVAMALAVLDSDAIKHPPIEAVFTINEETGMDGAQFLDASKLDGKTMLNIDSEVEGVITCGCAGGAHVLAQFPLNSNTEELYCAELNISGLIGGHSGNEIHKNRANSNILMGKLLGEINAKTALRLVSINGGEKDNAIANASSCTIAFDEADRNVVLDAVLSFAKCSYEKYSSTDPEMDISVTEIGKINVSAVDVKTSGNIITALSTVPDGVQTMSPDIEGLVESSLNLGVATTEGDTLSLSFCLRSSATAEMAKMQSKLSEIITLNGGIVTVGGEYPAWEYKKDSVLREKAIAAYESLYATKPKLDVIHAGLECGLFADKIKDLDCISFGPNIPDIHTTNEKLDVASTQRVWEFLLKLLQSL